MQKTFLIGSIGSNAVVKASNGSEFITFDMCDNHRYTRKSDGVTVEDSTWYSVTLNASRKAILPYLTKGTTVFVEGRLTAKVYQDSKGQYRVGLSIICDTVEFCGKSNAVQQVPEDERPFD